MNQDLTTIEYRYKVVHTPFGRFLHLGFCYYDNMFVQNPDKIVPALFSKHGWDSMPVVTHDHTKYQEPHAIPLEAREAFLYYEQAPATESYKNTPWTKGQM